jgi:hypothetical protein
MRGNLVKTSSTAKELSETAKAPTKATFYRGKSAGKENSVIKMGQFT